MITVAAHAADGAAAAVDAVEDRERLEREVRGAAEHDDAREEAIGVEADELRPQARQEPEVGKRRPGKERGGGARWSRPSSSAGRASAT